MKLLAIDDNNDNLLTLKALLSVFLPEASLATTLSGREGLALARILDPDAILLDIQMPEMDGFEVARTLKGDMATQHIPIIMLTALSTDSKSKVKALDVGADAFLAKPLDENELVAQVKAMVRIRRSEVALRRERDWLEDQVAERLREIHEKQRMNQLLIDALPHYAYLISPDLVIVALNRIAADEGAKVGDYCWCGVCKMEGISPEQKEHYVQTGVPLPGTRCALCRLHEAMETRKTIKSEFSRGGRYFEAWWIPIDTRLCFHYLVDITEWKHSMQALLKSEEDKLVLEKQFQHAQKLESLGVLAGGIAHDFNNILAIIMGYSSLVKMDYETARDHIPEIEKAAERAAGLCRQMLEYAGKAPFNKVEVDISALVVEMAKMLTATIQQNVAIKLDLSADIPTFNGDVSQLRQVVMNLIINAAEAIDDAQGEILVSLAKKEISSGHPERDHLGQAIPPGWYACLEVTDTGCGMDDTTRRRIFEPFYTTKFTGRGLGMSAVLGIISTHKGALQFSSQPGHGTTFKMYLPLQIRGTVVDDNPGPSVPAVPWRGSGTILLVEDEEQIRNIARMMLNIFGFTVLEAANGKEALELYLQHAADITLILTDIGMPVLDGYALFRELKTLDPKLPIIITSGFGEGDVTSRLAGEDIAGIINKPYNPDQLRNILKSVLENAT
jgi:CheY-like chemotaxis protein